MGASSARRRGRPKGGFDPSIQWQLAEQLFIHGEETSDESGRKSRRHPSMAEIARRLGVSKAAVTHRARRFNWHSRRRGQAQVSEIAGTPPSSRSVPTRANPPALDTNDVLSIINAFISNFGEAVCDNRVRADCVADLNTAVRLREFVNASAAAAASKRTSLPTLEEVQARHREAREQQLGLDPALAGVVPGRTEREAEALAEQAKRHRATARPCAQASGNATANPATTPGPGTRANPGDCTDGGTSMAKLDPWEVVEARAAGSDGR